MNALLKKYRHAWLNRHFLITVCASVAIFAVSIVCMLASQDYLNDGNVKSVSSPDFILDRLPTMGLENFIVWGVPMLIAFIGFILLMYPERIPFSLKTLGTLLIIRSFFILLTPLGVRPDQWNSSPVGFFETITYGNDFFFSGHVAVPFLFALIFWRETLIRNIFLSVSGLFAIGVLLAHAHYSIDVFVVPFMVPTIYRICIVLFKKDRSWTLAEPLL